MAKAVVLIDGFNLYHALDSVSRYGGYRYHLYKWVNYWTLSTCFLPKTDTLSRVLWYTAECPWPGASGDSKRKRWRCLKVANQDQGVEIVAGHFRPVTKSCTLDIPRARIAYKTFEEKRTDVAIAVRLVSLAHMRAYDKLVLITADSDMIPAVMEAKSVHPDGTVVNVVPIERRAQALKQYVDLQISMRLKHLRQSRLPSVLVLANGNTLNCPSAWELP